jgi:hypothetical protein
MQTIEFIPKLSAPSKMPCPSFSTPAAACHTGAKLAQIEGSVCHGCYAKKGNYRYDNVIKHRENNLKSLDDLSVWRRSMIKVIKDNDATGYFRWHDSGDIQSTAHLIAIIDIAQALPDIKFWLPTKEKGMINQVRRQMQIPDNLIIRLSMPMIDQPPNTKSWGLTSTVRTKGGEVHGVECKAPENNKKCGTCRACWDKTISNITYLKH